VDSASTDSTNHRLEIIIIIIMVQMVEHLPCKLKALSSKPNTNKRKKDMGGRKEGRKERRKEGN
jgi:hypothetical protein